MSNLIISNLTSFIVHSLSNGSVSGERATVRFKCCSRRCRLSAQL